MKIEMKIDWESLPAEPRNKPMLRESYPAPPHSQAERKLWYIALGREIEEAVSTERFTSLAEISRACGVSRARVSQLFILHGQQSLPSDWSHLRC